MSADPRTAPDFALDVDYSFDKIIYMKPGSATVGAFSGLDIPIAHGLNFTPLMDGTYSTDPLFQSSFDIGSGSPAPLSSGFFDLGSTIDADRTNAYLRLTNYTGSPITIYYRLFGFMPSNFNEIAEFTNSQADSFIVNSDYNYTKLFTDQRLTSNTSIAHPMGRRLQVAAWYETKSTGNIAKAIFAAIGDPFGNILVKTTTTDVQVTILSASYAAHVRVYLDE